MRTPEVEALRVCTACGLGKPLHEYRACGQSPDGLKRRCKKCMKGSDDLYRTRNQPALARSRKKYQLVHADRICARKLLYQQSTYPKAQRSANDALAKAVRSGRVIRRPCEICGSKNSHGRHFDYSVPLDVVWLCPAHHRQIHRGLFCMAVKRQNINRFVALTEK